MTTKFRRKGPRGRSCGLGGLLLLGLTATVARGADLSPDLLPEPEPRPGRWVTPASERSDSIAPSGLEARPPYRASAAGEPFAPEALAIDGLGRLFALDRARSRIVRIPPRGSWLPFGVGGQGGPRFAQLSRIFARWGADLYALDPAAGVLYQLDLDGHLKKSLHYGGSALDGELGFVDPVDFALNKAGELLLLDRNAGRVLLFDRFGSFVTDLTEGTAGDQRPQAPTRLALDEEGGLYLLDPPGNSIRRYSRQGGAHGSWRFDAGLPRGAATADLLAVTPWNQVVVGARDGSWLRVFTRDGTRLLDDDLEPPGGRPVTDLVAGPDSLLYLARPSMGEILRYQLLYPDPGPPAPR